MSRQGAEAGEMELIPPEGFPGFRPLPPFPYIYVNTSTCLLLEKVEGKRSGGRNFLIWESAPPNMTG